VEVKDSPPQTSARSVPSGAIALVALLHPFCALLEPTNPTSEVGSVANLVSQAMHVLTLGCHR
jgi:hypothetical protein